jgi:hypothetical protein
MQILRFDDEVVPARKRTGFSKGLYVIAAIGILLGVGTAFASSTIAINSGNGVTLGQGVSQVTGCDSSITVATAAGLLTATASTPSAPAPTFFLKTLTLSDIDSTRTDPTTGVGCGGKFLKVQLFYTVELGGAKTETARSCSELGSDLKSSSSSNSTYSCKDSALYLSIPAATSQLYTDTITFPNTLSSDLDYVTLVSTDSVA